MNSGTTGELMQLVNGLGSLENTNGGVGGVAAGQDRQRASRRRC